MTGNGGGGTMSKCSKTIYYKNVLGTYFAQTYLQWHVFRALVMIVYQVINCLKSQPKHMLWVLKRTDAMIRFF